MIECFAKSRQGASHIKKNKPCQDASGCFIGEKDEKYHLAVVADGHGSDEYFRSDRGSQFAVEVTHKVIDHFIKQHTGTVTDEHLQNIEKAIIDQWQKMVLADIKNSPWTNEEKAACKQTPSVQDISIYGTTLLAIAMTSQFWFALQIGDGACVVIDDEGPRFAVADDNSQGFGATHSLCEQNALKHFRHTFKEGILFGGIVATDGVSDSVSSDSYLFKFTVSILKSFAAQPDKAKKEIENEVLPVLSQQGSQDDVSLAGIINADAARLNLNWIVKLSDKGLQCKTLERNKETLEKDKKTLEKERSDLKAQVSGLERNKETLERDKKNLEKERSDLKAQVSGLERNKETLERDKKNLEKERSDLKAQVSGLERNKETLERDKKNLEKERSDLKAQVSSLERNKETLERDKKSLEEEKRDLKATVEKVIREVMKGYESPLAEQLFDVRKTLKDLAQKDTELACRVDQCEAKKISLEISTSVKTKAKRKRIKRVLPK